MTNALSQIWWLIIYRYSSRRIQQKEEKKNILISLCCFCSNEQIKLVRFHWFRAFIFLHVREREREIERLGVFNQKRRYKNKEIPREWLCRIASQLGLFSSVFLYNYVVNFFPLLLSDSPCCFSNPFFACAQWTWLGIFHFFFQNLLSSSSSSFLYCRTRSRRKRRRK